MTVSTTTNNVSSPPIWLRIVAVIGVVWYAFGLLQFWFAYSMDTGAAVSAGTISAEHGAAIAGTPLAIWLAFAIASAAGLVGSALLFVRTPLAKVVFGISLVSAAIYYAWVYGLSGTGADRPSEEIYIAAMVGAVTLAFFLLSRRQT